ncbi:SLC17A6 [Branchiostoma lanceolatum]|uniref:SLC17A6 protein n=1 Tax=Branchiostoma lanceolatum TaxID=7740 RepID=A0A8K0EPU5_BRALA|nr:SLC17A6 [Branchiostoma lanceolatum]
MGVVSDAWRRVPRRFSVLGLMVLALIAHGGLQPNFQVAVVKVVKSALLKDKPADQGAPPESRVEQPGCQCQTSGRGLPYTLTSRGGVTLTLTDRDLERLRTFLRKNLIFDNLSQDGRESHDNRGTTQASDMPMSKQKQMEFLKHFLENELSHDELLRIVPTLSTEKDLQSLLDTAKDIANIKLQENTLTVQDKPKSLPSSKRIRFLEVFLREELLGSSSEEELPGSSSEEEEPDEISIPGNRLGEKRGMSSEKHIRFLEVFLRGELLNQDGEASSLLAHSQREFNPLTQTDEWRPQPINRQWYMSFLRNFLSYTLETEHSKAKREVVKRDTGASASKHEKKSSQTSSEMNDHSKKKKGGKNKVVLPEIPGLQDEAAEIDIDFENIMAEAMAMFIPGLNETEDGEDKRGLGQMMAATTMSPAGMVFSTHIFFLAGATLTSFIGGMLSAVFSPVRLLGGTIFAACIIHMVTPLALNCRMDYIECALRLMQGGLTGLIEPATYGVMSHWAAKNERSTVVSLVTAGLTSAHTIGMLESVALYEAIGWFYSFYVIGGTGALLALLFFFSSPSTPEDDPKMSVDELIHVTKGKDKGISAYDGPDPKGDDDGAKGDDDPGKKEDDGAKPADDGAAPTKPMKPVCRAFTNTTSTMTNTSSTNKPPPQPTADGEDKPTDSAESPTEPKTDPKSADPPPKSPTEADARPRMRPRSYSSSSESWSSEKFRPLSDSDMRERIVHGAESSDDSESEYPMPDDDIVARSTAIRKRKTTRIVRELSARFGVADTWGPLRLRGGTEGGSSPTPADLSGIEDKAKDMLAKAEDLKKKFPPWRDIIFNKPALAYILAYLVYTLTFCLVINHLADFCAVVLNEGNDEGLENMIQDLTKAGHKGLTKRMSIPYEYRATRGNHHGFNIKTCEYGPWLGTYTTITLLVAGFLADQLLDSGKVDITVLRKGFHIVGQVCGALLMLVIILTKDEMVTYYGSAAFMVFMGVTMAAGFTVTPMDIADRYAGILVGVAKTLASIVLLGCPMLFKFMNKFGMRGFEVAIGIMIGLVVLAAIIYGLLASAEPLQIVVEKPRPKIKLPKFPFPSISAPKVKIPFPDWFKRREEPEGEAKEDAGETGAPMSWYKKVLDGVPKPDINYPTVDWFQLPTQKALCSCMPKRYLIAMLSCIGFLIEYGARTNMGVAATQMVNNEDVMGQLFQPSEFEWTMLIVGVIHGAFFLGFLLSRPLGGFLVSRYPATIVFVLSIAVSSLVNLFIPVAATVHFSILVALRVIQGMSEGLTIPASYGIWTFWAPPTERSKLTSITVTGQYIGIVIGMPVSGVAVFNIDWRFPFWIYGGVGLVWSLIWYSMVYESPEVDKYIDPEELKFIQDSMTSLPGLIPPSEPDTKSEASEASTDAGESTTKSPPSPASSVGPDLPTQVSPQKTPWRHLLTSLPVYAILVCDTCVKWVVYLMLLNAPMYYVQSFKVNELEAGAFAGLHFFLLMFGLPLVGSLADWVWRTQSMSTTTMRKLFNTLGMFVEGALLLTVGMTSNIYVSTICLSIALFFQSFPLSAGYNVNALDIAPQFASSIMGLSGSLSTVIGIACPIAIGAITMDKTPEEWNIVFIVSAGMILCAGLLYLLFGSGEVQDWADFGPNPSVSAGDPVPKGNECGLPNMVFPDPETLLDESVHRVQMEDKDPYMYNLGDREFSYLDDDDF